MPTIYQTKNKIHIHIKPKSFYLKAKRIKHHDIGRKGHSLRTAVLVNGIWYTYKYIIDKKDAKLIGKNTLEVWDKKVYDLLQSMKSREGAKINIIWKG